MSYRRREDRVWWGRWRTTAIAAVAGLAAFVGLACAGSGGMQGEDQATFGGGAETAEIAALQVDNQQPTDYAVHMVTETGDHRLGLASSMETSTFEIRSSMLPGFGGVQFVADPVGSSDLHRSAEVQLGEGDLAEWTLQATPGLSRGSIEVRTDAVREVDGEAELEGGSFR